MSNEITPSVLREYAKSLSMTQTELATAIGATQGQISRILSGGTKGKSKLYKKICSYVKNKQTTVTSQHVTGNAELIDALTKTWDGTDQHARAISAVILSLQHLHRFTESRV